ncbi:MAG: hypothetical protein V4717_02985 [Bacteroidota bacterium]
MKQKCNLLLLLLAISQLVTSQSVGIGTLQPKAMLAIDGGLVIDQGDHNTGSISAINNNALIFGSDMKTGIFNNRTPGLLSRSGLNFVTGGFRRMTIDSIGRVSINTNTALNFSLNVGGNSYFADAVVGNNLEIGGRLSINSSNKSALLYLKGILPENDWGQHIMMESRFNSETGAILYDDFGMKFRNFGVGDKFYFRNSANENSMTIDDDGNITNNGAGMVTNSSSTQLKTFLYSGGVAADLGVGKSVTFVIGGWNFSSIPYVAVAQVPGGTASYDKVIYTIHDVTTTTAIVTMYNPTNVTADISGTFRAIAIGAK